MSELANALCRLEAERAALCAQLEAQDLPQVDQMTYGNQAEAASAVFEQSRAVSLRRHLELQLQQVEDSILRLQRGGYGICEECGQLIPPERLEVLPEARLCVECQRRRSRRR